jgi:hypothetical protein
MMQRKKNMMRQTLNDAEKEEYDATDAQ